MSDRHAAAPAADELEVTVIGPGFGEAILVHVGHGKWFIVDSCSTSTKAQPEPLRYLDSIGVSPQQVFSVFITHWDDDHCKGISNVVSTCSNAQLVMSKAFVEKDFLAFAAAFKSPMTSRYRAGPKEILNVFEQMSGSTRKIVGAVADRRIFTSSSLGLPASIDAEIWTFSPSDDEFDNFLAWVADQMPLVGETRRVAVKRIRNDLSVVIYLKINDDVILLGGDLEEEGNKKTGWSAILASGGRPTEKAKLFKVPHHGSVTGFHHGVLTDLLQAEPTAIVAPFKNGSVSLPQVEDVKRICHFAGDAHATATLKARSADKYDRTIQKTIDEVTLRFSTPRQTEPGTVRLRKKIGSGGPWQHAYFGTAGPLATIL